MSLKVIMFGRLADIAGNSLTIDSVADTDSLTKKLHNTFPALAGACYLIAVDKELINSNTVLNENSEVALLPPYSGG